MKELLSLFWAFFKIGSLTFGGGYSMLPMMERELIDNHGWVKNEELLDYYAVSQCTPGVIAVNTATFVGTKIKGTAGAAAATVGVVFPSLIIISVIAAVLNNFSDIPAVKHAFTGIRACVCVLILNSVKKLWKSAVKDKFTVTVFAVSLALSFLLGVSPIIIVLAGSAAGIAFRYLRGTL